MAERMAKRTNRYSIYPTARTAGINACGNRTSMPRAYLARVLQEYRGSGRNQEAHKDGSWLTEACDFGHW